MKCSKSDAWTANVASDPATRVKLPGPGSESSPAPPLPPHLPAGSPHAGLQGPLREFKPFHVFYMRVTDSHPQHAHQHRGENGKYRKCRGGGDMGVGDKTAAARASLPLK